MDDHDSGVESEQPHIPRASVLSVRLGDDSELGAATSEDGTDPLIRFKHQQLGCVVMDEPWDTSLVWADAQVDLHEVDANERDQAVVEVLVRMQDEGLVCFFEVKDFGDSYSRTPSEAERLSRERLLEVLASGSSEGEHGRSAPFLGIRATAKGRDVHFDLWPGDRHRLNTES